MRSDAWRCSTFGASWLRRSVIGAVCLVVVLGLTGPAVAGGPSPTWVRATAFRAESVAAAPAGGAVVVGVRGAGREDQIAVIRTYRPDGTARWTTTWVPSVGWAAASAVAVSADGIFVAGAMGPDRAPPPCNEIGSFSRFVLALNHRGRVLWLRGDTTWKNCHSDAATAVGAGRGLVVVATTRSIEGSIDYHGRMVAFTAGGRRLWANGFEVPGLPWASADSVSDLETDVAGRSFAAGNAWSRAVLDPPADSEAVLQALTRDGDRRWSKVFGEPGKWLDDRDRGTAVDVRGGRVMFGAMIDLQDPKGVRSRLMSFTTAGERQWVQGFKAVAAHSARTVVALGRSGRAYASSSVRDDVYGGMRAVLRAFSEEGRVLWERALGGSRRVVDLDAGQGLFVLQRNRVLRFPG
ncbi:MAG: hypothetical protein OEW66_03125 [Actinomycetota bacterium]|nr:hypothetical protein [Actinomycetota bacterium]